MSVEEIQLAPQSEPLFDDGGLSGASAHRIHDLLERISASQEQHDVTPNEPTDELTVLEGFVQNAVYKDAILTAEAQLQHELETAEEELARIEYWRNRDHELGVGRLIADECLDLLHAWRVRGDRDALRKHSIIAQNTENAIRRREKAQDEVVLKKKALAEHRESYADFYQSL